MEVGTRTAVEVLTARTDLYRAESDYAQARYDYILNTLLLKQVAVRCRGDPRKSIAGSRVGPAASCFSSGTRSSAAMSTARPPRELSFLSSAACPGPARCAIVRLPSLVPAIGGTPARCAVPRIAPISRVNLALCPELSSAEREDLLRRHSAHSDGVLETGMARCLPDHRSPVSSWVHGLEHLQSARAEGRGVILLSAHVTGTELGVRLLNLLTPVHPMYREHENPVLRALMHGSFKPHFERVIPRDAVRTMLKSLREGHAVWYAPDQNYRGVNHVFVPFFGIAAATNAATSRFARMGNALVIPYFPQRLPDGRGYRLTLMPPLADFPGDSEEADCMRINTIIEDEVRQAPEQYLWVHRRFKTRPSGEPDLYGR